MNGFLRGIIVTLLLLAGGYAAHFFMGIAFEGFYFGYIAHGAGILFPVTLGLCAGIFVPQH